MKEESKLSTTLEKSIKILIYALIFLLPLFYLPFINNAFEFSKQVLLISFTVIISLLWAVKMISNKKITVRKTPFDLPLLAILVVFILATIFSQNRLTSLIGLSGSLHWNLIEAISLYILYYAIASNIKEKKEVTTAFGAFISSAFVLSIMNLLSYFSVIKPEFVGNIVFNPINSPTNLTIMNAVALIVSTGLFIDYLKRLNNKPVTPPTKTQSKLPNMENKVFLVTFLYSLFAIILVLTIFLISPLTVKTANKVTNVDYPSETFLNFDASWNISMDTFQNVPLLGSGPSTFLYDYNRFHPQSINSEDYWAIRFNKPANEYLLFLSEVGIFGVLALLVLIIQVVRSLPSTISKDSGDREGFYSLATVVFVLISFGFTFSTLPTIFILYVFLALAGVSLTSLGLSEDVTLSLSILKEGISSLGSSDRKVNLKKGGFFHKKTSGATKDQGNVEALPWIFLIVILSYTIFTGYYVSKFFIAEYNYKKAITALNDNEGIATYDYLQEAITANPYRDQYRNTYAQTSLLIANAISQGQELTDQDRLNIEQLLQQSVNEVRISTEVIAPQNAANWQLRGQVYQQLIGVADSAENWAIDGYTNAIALDPNNPLLRLELGSLYYQLEEYDQALNNFQNAALLKRDYTNAYYNLSIAYKKINQNELAYTAMQQVENLIKTDSPDYERIQTELEELRDLLPQEMTETTNEATIE
jgi:type IV pilus assembly protein PilF